jgi:hypothetical protein
VGRKGVEGRRRFGPVLPCVVAGLSASACWGDSSPCFGVTVGDRIAVTVVDTFVGALGPYDSGRAGVCGFGLDVTQGLVLQATVVSNPPNPRNSCHVGIARYQPFAGWTWTLSVDLSSPGVPPSVLVGEYAATNGTCTGLVQVDISVVRGTDPFAPSTPGQPPNVVMSRDYFSGGGPGCPASCVGEFVVNLQRQ